MESIGIVTDSHSGIRPAEAKSMGIRVIPMPFTVDGVSYYEDVSLSREEILGKLRERAKISTSQLAPDEVCRAWDEALATYDKILYMPISSGLSGSYGTAAVMAGEPPYKGRVFVSDHGRVSTPLAFAIKEALDMIREGYRIQEILKSLEEARHTMVIYIGLQTLFNLKQGGRITPAGAAVAEILNIRPVMRFDVGTLDVYRKCRGFEKAKKTMLNAVRGDLETRFQTALNRGEVTVLAASSASDEETARWEAMVREAFPGLPFMGGNLSLGTSCHIGYGGLGIGLSCRLGRPRR